MEIKASHKATATQQAWRAIPSNWPGDGKLLEGIFRVKIQDKDNVAANLEQIEYIYVIEVSSGGISMVVGELRKYCILVIF